MIIHLDLKGLKGGGAFHLLDLCTFNAESKVATLEGSWLHLKAVEMGIDVIILPVSLFDIYKFIKRFYKVPGLIVHAHGRGASIYTRLLSIFGVKVVYTPHGFVKTENKFRTILNFIFERLTINLHTRVIAISNSEYNALQAYVCKKKLVYLENWSRIPAITIDERQLNIKNLAYDVVSIIRFHEQKNPFEILKIAEMNPDLSFAVAGEGPLFDEFQHKACDMNISNLNLLGPVDNVEDLLDRSRLLLSTSLHEGMPLTLLEALARGVPIGASDVVGNNDIVDHQFNGFLYKLGELSELSMYIRSMLEDDLYYELVVNSISSSVAYSLSAARLKYKTFYESF